MQLHAVDRDALAVSIAQENACLNRITGAVFEGALGLKKVGEPAEGRGWDLIVSNLPAKAGRPVIEELLLSFSAYLSSSGLAAVVIVKTLESLVEKFLHQSGCEVLYRRRTREHAVFHFRSGGSGRADAPENRSVVVGRGSDRESMLIPYIRQKASFHVSGVSWELYTVYNLSEFDTIGHGTHLALDLLRDVEPEGTGLFWNPGQGHIPVWLNQRSCKVIHKWVLAGRDLLALEIARKNLLTSGVPQESVYLFHTPFFYNLAVAESMAGDSGVIGDREGMGFQVYLLEHDPNMSWYGAFFDTAVRLAGKSGLLLVVAKSSLVHRIFKHKKSFALLKDRKSQGFRGLLLARI
jgi:hypothetical protein